jgi:hypothetical protein
MKSSVKETAGNLAGTQLVYSLRRRFLPHGSALKEFTYENRTSSCSTATGQHQSVSNFSILKTETYFKSLWSFFLLREEIQDKLWNNQIKFFKIICGMLEKYKRLWNLCINAGDGFLKSSVLYNVCDIVVYLTF